ncbi:MAG: HAD family hydrolase [Clostridia bacterium]|nr:HAD family hydrolase [Clostridia bacterium]
MKPIILFDLDETLFESPYDYDCAADTLYAALSIPADARSRIDQIRRRCFSEAWKACGIDDISTPADRAAYHTRYDTYALDRFIRFAKTAEITAMTPTEMNDLFLCDYAKRGTPIEGAVDLLARLKAEGRIICIATNGLVRTQPNRIARSPIAPFIDHLFVSEAIGNIKPDPIYFGYILKTLGAKADDCIMCGDSINHDIAGAYNIGMDSLHFNRKNAPADPRAAYEIKAWADFPTEV